MVRCRRYQGYLVYGRDRSAPAGTWQGFLYAAVAITSSPGAVGLSRLYSGPLSQRPDRSTSPARRVIAQCHWLTLTTQPGAFVRRVCDIACGLSWLYLAAMVDALARMASHGGTRNLCHADRRSVVMVRSCLEPRNARISRSRWAILSP